MRFPQGWELIVVLVVVLLLFGSKKLPDAARGLGRSLRIFKSEIKTMQDDDETATPVPPKPITSGEARTDVTGPAPTSPAAEAASNEPRPETPPRVDG
jgi:sec-independent protein translocase protein TatA